MLFYIYIKINFLFSLILQITGLENYFGKNNITTKLESYESCTSQGFTEKDSQEVVYLQGDLL